MNTINYLCADKHSADLAEFAQRIFGALRAQDGRIHEVVIADTGVQYNGKAYGSLSEVARIITGVKWSGTAFFGLKVKRGKGA